MLIILAGLPGSGKSSVLEGIKNKSDITIIDPTCGLPTDINILPDNDQRDYRIAGWQIALEDLRKEVNDQQKKCIIFDSCASKYKPFETIVLEAKLMHRKIVYAYIKRDRTKCIEIRDESVILKYEQDYKASIPEFVSIANNRMIINNDKGIETARSEFKRRLIEILRSGWRTV